MAEQRLLLIGWDAADWMMISPLMDSGGMPHLASLVERGVMANLASARPCLSPMLWTSIATGKSADQHGILGFVEPDPNGSDIRVIRGSSRRSSALWNMFESKGMATVVVDWPVTHPAERSSGRFVSDLYYGTPPGDLKAFWPHVESSVWPLLSDEATGQWRIHPCEFDPPDLSAWIPNLPYFLPDQLDPRPGLLAETIARDASSIAIFTSALQETDWRFATICLHGLDTAGHVFMPYHAPRRSHISKADFETYQHVMNAMYRFYDGMLGTVMGMVDADTTIMLVSDHGFHSDHRRPLSLPMQQMPETDAAAWHRMYGVFAMAGPGIRTDQRIYGATIFDIAPTALQAMGLPAGRDMLGRAFVQAWTNPQPITPIASWEPLAGRDQWRSNPQTDASVDETDSGIIERLVDLGYLPDSVARKATVKQNEVRLHFVIDEASLNLAIVHLHHNRPGQAIGILEDLVRQSPDSFRFNRLLAHAYSRIGRFADVERLIKQLEAAGDSGIELELLMSQACSHQKKQDECDKRIQRALAIAPDSVDVQRCAGDMHYEQSRLDKAGGHYREGSRLDPEDIGCHLGLARTEVRLNHFEEALNSALEVLSRVYFHPEAHFMAGQAWVGLGDPARAIRSLELALAQAPDYGPAKQLLSRLYKPSNQEPQINVE